MKRRLCWVGAAVATALCACGAPTPEAPASPTWTHSTTDRLVPTSTPDRSPVATAKRPASPHPTRPARPGPYVTLRAGDFPEPRIPALPKSRTRAGATVTVTGKWAARLNLERPTSMVRCSKYSDAAGVQRVYESATDINQMGEYGTVFNTYGPIDDDYTAERAQLWQHHAVRVVVPNNAKIARALERNRNLLQPLEVDVADRFVLHQTEFAARHVLHDHAAGTTTFPDGMDNILRSET